MSCAGLSGTRRGPNYRKEVKRRVLRFAFYVLRSVFPSTGERQPRSPNAKLKRKTKENVNHSSSCCTEMTSSSDSSPRNPSWSSVRRSVSAPARFTNLFMARYNRRCLLPGRRWVAKRQHAGDVAVEEIDHVPSRYRFQIETVDSNNAWEAASNRVPANSLAAGRRREPG
jgi:hypothetical protein